MQAKILAVLGALVTTSATANPVNSVIVCIFPSPSSRWEFVIKFGGSIGEGKAVAIFRDGDDTVFPADFLRTDTIYALHNLRMDNGGDRDAMIIIDRKTQAATFLRAVSDPANVPALAGTCHGDIAPPRPSRG